MSILKKKAKEQEEEKDVTTLLDQFKAEKGRVVLRTVKLKYKSCCGCGCSEEKIRRDVPIDSDLRDGDFVDILELGDRDGWK